MPMIPGTRLLRHVCWSFALVLGCCHGVSSSNDDPKIIGTCSPAGDIATKVVFTGFAPGKNGIASPDGYISKGSWLTAQTSNCTVRWLQIATNGINVSILHPGTLLPPSQVDVTAVATATCPAGQVLPTLSVDGWDVQKGTLSVALAVAQDWTPVGIGWDVTVASSDLVLRNPVTGEDKVVGFQVETRLIHRCAKQGADVTQWSVLDVGMSASGIATCGLNTGAVGTKVWKGDLSPINPPFFCDDVVLNSSKSYTASPGPAGADAAPP